MKTGQVRSQGPWMRPHSMCWGPKSAVCAWTSPFPSLSHTSLSVIQWTWAKSSLRSLPAQTLCRSVEMKKASPSKTEVNVSFIEQYMLNAHHAPGMLFNNEQERQHPWLSLWSLNFCDLWGARLIHLFIHSGPQLQEKWQVLRSQTSKTRPCPEGTKISAGKWGMSILRLGPNPCFF